MEWVCERCPRNDIHVSHPPRHRTASIASKNRPNGLVVAPGLGRWDFLCTGTPRARCLTACAYRCCSSLPCGVDLVNSYWGLFASELGQGQVRCVPSSSSGGRVVTAASRAHNSESLPATDPQERLLGTHSGKQLKQAACMSWNDLLCERNVIPCSCVSA